VSILIDTNVLLRRLESQHPQHAMAISAVARILRSGETVYVTLQVLTEVWRVMTAPTGANGFDFPISVSAAAIDDIEPLFTLLDEDVPAIYSEWKRLVVQHQVKGLAVFDARLAATVIVHKLDAIVSFDAGFARYGVNVLDPATV
jgi:predicted nucleic acid-binding protein